MQTAIPAREFTFNLGVAKATYDPATGLHCNFGRGIYEFRIGDEVVNIHNGKRDVIAALYPREDGTRGGSPCIVEVGGGRRCCVLVDGNSDFPIFIDETNVDFMDEADEFDLV